MERMPVVYVAGAYRANSEWEVVQNIRKAEHVAIDLWRMGYAVICPHKNTALFGGAAPDSVWLKGDLEILRRCDLVYLLPNWEESKGAVGEKLLADKLGIPTVDGLKGAKEWIQQYTPPKS